LDNKLNKNSTANSGVRNGDGYLKNIDKYDLKQEDICNINKGILPIIHSL